MHVIFLSSPLVTSASSKHLANVDVVGCSKVESRGTNSFLRLFVTHKIQPLTDKTRSVYTRGLLWEVDQQTKCIEFGIGPNGILLNYLLLSLCHFRCPSSPDINQWFPSDSTPTINFAD